MSKLSALAQKMHEVVPTANHDWEPLLSDTEQADTLRLLFEAYPDANTEDKAAIEKGFYLLLTIQSYLVNTGLFELINHYIHKYPFIEEKIAAMDDSSYFMQHYKKQKK